MIPNGTLDTDQQKVIKAATELKTRRSARTDLIEFSRFTYPTYAASWFHILIAKYLEQLTLGKLDLNMMIFAPPQHGKSELVCIRRPAWAIGVDPTRHFIGTAYGDKLATQFSKAVRNTIESPTYQRLFPLKMKTRGDTTWEVERPVDDQRPTYVASGILSSITGIGATDLLIDDPVKNAEEAYSQVYRQKVYDNYQTAANTRLVEGGKKCLVMTRWHEDDLAGRLLKLAVTDKKADQWLVICLAATNDEGQDSYVWNTRSGEKTFLPKYEALWPEAKSRDFLDQQKANLGPVFWNAMYMQRPTAPAGVIFKRENWRYHDQQPTFEQLVQVWDTACEEGQENDYSATIDLGYGGGGFPVLDAWRGKVAFPDLVVAVYERWERAGNVYGRYPDRLVVERKASGIQLIQQLELNNITGHWVFPDGETRAVPPIPIISVQATSSKVVRAHGVSGYHASKLVSLPRDADWVADYVDEHALFPRGVHDDWVDVTVHGLTYYTRPTEDVEETAVADMLAGADVLSDLDMFDLRLM